jgi:hypothetical protein
MTRPNEVLGRLFHPYNLAAVWPLFAIAIPVLLTPVPLVPSAQAEAVIQIVSHEPITRPVQDMSSSDPSLLHSEPNAYFDEGGI